MSAQLPIFVIFNSKSANAFVSIEIIFDVDAIAKQLTTKVMKSYLLKITINKL